MSQPLSVILREARGACSLGDAAKALGISKTYLWELEQGNWCDPSFRKIARIAEHYKLDLNELAKCLNHESKPCS